MSLLNCRGGTEIPKCLLLILLMLSDLIGREPEESIRASDDRHRALMAPAIQLGII